MAGEHAGFHHYSYCISIFEKTPVKVIAWTRSGIGKYVLESCGILFVENTELMC